MRRPVIRYLGGKWILGKKIIPHFPQHLVYCEPYGGGASILLQKPRAMSEVYNDINKEVTSFFQVLQNADQAEELVRLVELTLFSREEFNKASKRSRNPVERARRFLIRSYMGFGPDNTQGQTTGFRGSSSRTEKGEHGPRGTAAGDWRNYPPALVDAIKRFQGVVVENKPALEVMQAHDSVETLHYLDPPYVHETRFLRKNDPKCRYAYELSDKDHERLAEVAHTLKGMIIISGYRCDQYDRMYSDWERLDFDHYAHKGSKRVESIWINPAAKYRLQPSLL